MKKLYLLFYIVLFCTVSYGQKPEAIRKYIIAFFDQIQVTDNDGKFIASVGKDSQVTYNEQNYYQFEIITSLYDLNNSKWFDVKYKVHLDEMLKKTKEADTVNYMYKASTSNDLICMLYFGVDEIGMIDGFIIIFNINGIYYYTELLRKT